MMTCHRSAVRSLFRNGRFARWDVSAEVISGPPNYTRLRFGTPGDDNLSTDGAI